MQRKDKHLELKVGALICVGVIALGAMVVYFQQFKTHREVYVLYATFTFAGGIQPGTPVRVAGYHVGQVRSVEWDSEDQLVRAELEIDIGYRIKEDAKLIIDTVGMLGEPYLEFTAGSQDAPYLKPKSTVRGGVPPSLTAIRVEALTMVTTINETVKELSDLITSVRKDVVGEISGRAKEAGKVLGEAEKLIKDLRTTNSHLNKTLENISDISLQVREGGGTAHKLIYEKGLYDHAAALLSDADAAAKKLASLADYLRKHPSHLVWGRGVAWYKRAWRWTLNKISGRGDEDDKAKPVRPDREDRRPKINLMETTLQGGEEGEETEPEPETGQP